MKFLLKIVQGPNAGAEIALVEGVRVTLGSADSCDIVLADPTLAAEACAIEASADSVTLSVPGSEPEPLAPLQVRSFGSTALAVGPADSPWGPLVWAAPSSAEAAEGAGEAARPESAPPKEADSAAPESTKSAETEKTGADSADSGDKPRSRKRGLLRGCLVALLVLLLLLAAAAWFLLPHRRPASPDGPAPSGPATAESSSGIADIAARYGLEYFPDNEPPLVRGDLPTRAKRIAATAELYEAQPGVALDLADRETLLTAVTDLLQAATDGALAVSDVTNRIVVLAGRAPDPTALRAWREALLADVPRLSGADTAAVVLDSPVSAPAVPGAGPRPARAQRPRLPLRCILLQPYPCLVLQDGQRLLEGAEVADGYKISEITFDRITFRRGEEEELEWTP
ncbi:MAG: hypothetical protein II839_09075 [Kiritimatiellae bacterium]|nr:hypothetical protein [Kiritimatiellia bacterium]